MHKIKAFQNHFKVTHCKYGNSGQTPTFSNIKGILFDVDGTLYYQTPLRAIILFLLIFLNFYRPKELLRKLKVIIYYRKCQEILRHVPKMKRKDQKNQLMLTADKTGESISYVSDVVEEWFEKKPLPFMHLCRRREIYKVIDLMQKRGFNLGVFSDYPAEKKLEALGVLKFFKTVVSSSDHGIHGFKPNTNGFRIAAAKMGLEPSEVLYVGDRPDVDGLGGSEAGMKVVMLKSFLRKNRTGDYPFINSLNELLMKL